ncbi:MAG TPA: hypothetical protein VHH55_03115, partial [Gaiellaceae bacterium]|nr:hypothetical protein [Gaiellaceae bacterium]
GLGVAPDGTLLVCEQRANRLLRVDAPGRVSVVAGSGVRASTGDGGPAAAAALHTPTDVVAAADGTLFVQEGTSSGRVRRIAPNGRINTLRRR